MWFGELFLIIIISYFFVLFLTGLSTRENESINLVTFWFRVVLVIFTLSTVIICYQYWPNTDIQHEYPEGDIGLHRYCDIDHIINYPADVFGLSPITRLYIKFERVNNDQRLDEVVLWLMDNNNITVIIIKDKICTMKIKLGDYIDHTSNN
jgi:hypothetical protein